MGSDYTLQGVVDPFVRPLYHGFVAIPRLIFAAGFDCLVLALALRYAFVVSGVARGVDANANSSPHLMLWGYVEGLLFWPQWLFARLTAYLELRDPEDGRDQASAHPAEVESSAELVLIKGTSMNEDDSPLPLGILFFVLAVTVCASSMYFHVYLYWSRRQPQGHPQARDSMVQMFYMGSTWRARRAFLEEKARAAARWMFINAKRTRWGSEWWEVRKEGFPGKRKKAADTKKKK